MYEMKSSMKGLVAGLILGASVLINPLKAFPIPEKVFDKNFPVVMYYESGRTTEENIKIEAFYDDEKRKLTLSYFSGTYNRENWDKIEQRSPLDERYTELSDGGTRIYLVHPDDVNVSNVRERAWIVKQDMQGRIRQGFVGLTPLEQHPYLRGMFDLAGKAWDIVMKELGVKELTKAFDSFEKEIKASEKQEPKNIIEEINKKYSATRIIPYPIDFNDVATARTYDIYLDTTLKGEAPISLWIKIALGDPTVSATGKNKYGELEGIVINFNINKERIKIAELNNFLNYFPSASEKEGFELVPLKLAVLGDITSDQIGSSNPYIFNEEFLKKNKPDVNAKGIASYSLSLDGEDSEIGFYMEVYQLNSKKVPESFKKRAYQYSDLTYFGLSTDNLFVCFDSFMNYGEKLATKEQVLNYLNFIIDYKKRINASEVIMNKQDSKSIKEDFEKSPENLIERINDPRSYGFKSVEEAIRYLFSPVTY